MWQQVLNSLPHEDYSLKKLVVLTPYVSQGFIKNTFSELPGSNGDKDKFLVLIVDQNCSQSALMDVSRAFPKSTIRISKTNGLVHAKLYYFDFLNLTNKLHRRVIVFGSLNATHGGWERNAETLALVSLPDLEEDVRQELKDYLKGLEDADAVNAITISIDNVSLYLPGFTLFNYPGAEQINQPVSFDSWLQRGTLAHEFRGEKFGRFEVRLDCDADFLGDIPGWEARSARKISFNYTGVELNSEGAEQWKATYFIVTNYGLWTSDACYGRFQDDFIRAGGDARRSQLKYVKNLGNNNGQFTQAVQRCTNSLITLTNIRPDLLPYLKSQSKQLDTVFYRREAESQIKKHIVRANDNVFLHRHLHGYDFAGVPPLRLTDDLWEDFVESYIEDVLYKVRRRTKREIASRQSKVFRDYLGIDGTEDWDDVYDDMKKKWEKSTAFREAVMNFFNED